MPVIGEVKRQIGVDWGNGNGRGRGFDFRSVLCVDSDPTGPLQRFLRDRKLLLGLQEWDRKRKPMAVTKWGLPVRHPDVEPFLAESYDPDKFGNLRKRLADAGIFELHTQKEHSVIVDGEPLQITIIKATPVEANGDMDGKVWIRDQNEAVRTDQE